MGSTWYTDFIVKVNLRVVLVSLFFVLLAATSYLLYLLKNPSPSPHTGSGGNLVSQASPSPSPRPVGPTQTFTGKIVCLPLAEGVPSSEDSCALGLQDSSGKFYILYGLTMGTFPDENTNVEIQGGLIQDFFGSGQDKITYSYKIDGGIQVTSIKKI